MQTFHVVKYDDKEICLKSSKDLENLFNTITSEEDFILIAGKDSKIFLANKLLGKVKAGEIVLTSKEE